MREMQEQILGLPRGYVKDKVDLSKRRSFKKMHKFSGQILHLDQWADTREHFVKCGSMLLGTIGSVTGNGLCR